jgi:uncharacterized protein
VAGPRFDLPQPDADSQPFWDAARAGRLLYQRCGACNLAYAYARPFCPRCWSEDVSWQEASGRATLYTWSVVHRNDLPPFPERVPYVAAVVDLEEGPRLMANLVDWEDGRLEIGMALEVAFRQETDEITLPVFRAASA